MPVLRCSTCSNPLGPFHVTCEACEKPRVPPTLRMKPIEDLEISIRGVHCLRNLGIENVGELCQWSEKDLLACPNLGRRTLNEVKEVMHYWGVHLRAETVRDHYLEITARRATLAHG